MESYRHFREKPSYPVVERIRPPQEELVTGKKKRKTGREKSRGWSRLFFGLALGACLGRLQLPPGLFPAGPAFCGAWLKAGLPGGFLVLFLTFFSLYSSLPEKEFFARIIIYLPFLLGIKLARRKGHLFLYGMVSLLPAGLFLLLRFSGFMAPDLQKGLGEIGLVNLMVFLLSPGISFLFSQSPKPGKTRRNWVSLGFLASLVYVFLTQGLKFSLPAGIPAAPDLFFALFLVFLMVKKYGTGMGTATAVFFACVEAVAGEPVPARLVLIAGSGLAAGWGQDILPKYGLGLGFFLFLGLAAARWWGTPGLDRLLGAGVLLTAVILCCPAGFWRKMERLLPPVGGAGASDRQQKRLKELVVERLRSLAELFEQIAGAFFREDTEEQGTARQEIYSFIEKISEQNCRFCNSYSSCWGELFYSTYREIFDLIAAAEISGTVNSVQMKGRLARECTQKQDLLMAINSWMERQQAEHAWRKRYEEGRAFLAGQLQEMAGIMAGLSRHIKLSVDFRVEIEEELRAAFERMNLRIREMIVTGLEKNRIEIYLEKINCGSRDECCRVIAPLISQLLGTRFTVDRRNCAAGEGGWCSFYLSPHCCYRIRSAVERIPRDGSELSGDSHSLLETREGYVFSMLSDGMGTGPGAARQSSTTISLLQKLLNTGLEKDFCLQLVNSLLLLRSPEENFATLDLLVFDQFTAETELIKIGAAPTYIKRDKEVEVINSTSLPVGILQNVEPESVRCLLQENDVVVMVTDGVIDFRNREKEDWICKVLKKLDLSGVDSLGRYLLESAKIEAHGVVADDMTIVVLQVVKEKPGRKSAL